MRTSKEVIERVNARRSEDLFGFETNDLIVTLSAEDAKPFLKKEADLSGWEPRSRAREDVLVQMKDYMHFAFEKAHSQRGLSAMRSISHYTAWTWLAGDDELANVLAEADDSVYVPYGLPLLRRICEHYKWDPRRFGDIDWVNDEGK
jgi:hypothetical protein